ncbi:MULTISPECIES: sigma-54 dependent transcriptional regulator [unclassified Ensifer]|uniref:sigma-54-dependent transcriptional regulator n=1 Tax=unclassified Ensifer TaxID=2633371 RepID=UPI0008139F51|nr:MULTISPECIES: sigma-54 dependent transcriptional regulator [unclassified Ensifer]OCP08417.1 Fis family transcriptional regulator [Ensifer sp. LC11]OCP09036.1 Fis family transcriptional regulator [Ensifer sp. LC13]OCP09819.1 Fis family transcriptional regulator [Ensifer sp. LC14]OCP32274.1 Fis family transcriptional regulator [Ensifer sp. LC499]
MDDNLKVLIVEDEPNVRLGCRQTLELEGMEVVAVDSAENARRFVRADFPGVVVTDIRLPGDNGMALMHDFLQKDPDIPVVLMTGHGDVSLAVQAMKDGAHDFIEKPFSPDYFVEVVRRALEKRKLTLEVRALRAQLENRQATASRIIGQSSAIERVRYLIGELGNSAADVLIQGETGTGKELAARCLHDASARRNGNFVAINCGGVPENLFDSEIFGHEPGAFTGAAKRRIGKIEYANGGTLFLDEIESMPMAMQVKLLRVLQERTLERLGSNSPITVDCRVIGATKVDLATLAEKGEFRADLYYRLNVATLPLPPLRERREDIGLLFEQFALEAASRHERGELAPDVERTQRLLAYNWPGNVRELRNVAERCVLGIAAGFPPFGGATDPSPRPLARTVEDFERALIADALSRNGNSLARASEYLLVPKATLHDKIRKYGLT